MGTTRPISSVVATVKIESFSRGGIGPAARNFDAHSLQPMFLGQPDHSPRNPPGDHLADMAIGPKSLHAAPQAEPYRRRRPALPMAQPARRIVAFEPRLALSANPGAELLLNAWMAFPATELFGPVALQESSGPLAANDTPVDHSPVDTHSDSGSSAASWHAPPLVEQAATIRNTFGLSGAGQTVAVIDSGIAWDHVALGNGFGPGYRVVGGWDFAEDDADPYDDAPAGFHGSHVAGLIGGHSDVLSGIAPGADLVALRVFDDSGTGSLAWVESALQWVYDHRNAFDAPITTVNLSLGALMPEGIAADVHAQLEDELQLLRNESIVVVAAAGNGFDAAAPGRISYPASSENAWAVASLDADGSLSQYSQRSEGILATVGRGVTSSVPDHVLGWDGEVDDYHAASGTSMASPQIAAATVLLRQAMQQAGASATPDELLEHLQQTADRRIDAATGMAYYDLNLAAAIHAVLGPSDGGDGNSGTTDSIDDSPADDGSSANDLGRVTWSTANVSSGAPLRATAVREGLFSVAFEADENRPEVRITDANGRVLWDAVPPASGQIDVPVVADETLTISTTAGSSAAVRLANVISVQDGRLELATGVDDPDVSLDLSNGVAVSVAELRYAFAEGEIIAGTVDGGSGADRLHIIGSEGAARLILNPYADGTLKEGAVSFVLRNFEDVRFDGGGGGDRAYLYDTRGDDTLRASPSTATLEGVGFRYHVAAVERVYVHATAGGQDMAFLQDSPGDDVLAVRPQFVSLRGSEFFSSAYGFERVYAYASAGGTDIADLYDSAGDDRMTASAAAAMISGPGYYVQARHFDSVTGHATAGGNDRATLYAESDATDRWHHSSDFVALRTPEGAIRGARGFEQVERYMAGTSVHTFGASAVEVDRASGDTDDRDATEDWRSRALLELKVKETSAKSSEAAFCAPPVRRDAIERQMLQDIFADVGRDED